MRQRSVQSAMDGGLHADSEATRGESGSRDHDDWEIAVPPRAGHYRRGLPAASDGQPLGRVDVMG